MLFRSPPTFPIAELIPTIDFLHSSAHKTRCSAQFCTTTPTHRPVEHRQQGGSFCTNLNILHTSAQVVPVNIPQPFQERIERGIEFCTAYPLSTERGGVLDLEVSLTLDQRAINQGVFVVLYHFSWLESDNQLVTLSVVSKKGNSTYVRL